ncbi:hypothetical protein [Comamonas kerstersii]|uniref:hypothetical protein n=1 Tax=Comamonas kerstersii TaxID=225992 RepID=UPI00345D571D
MELAEREQAEEERRARVKKSMQEKQQKAAERRASKESQPNVQRGNPLPVPEGLPQPKD